MFKYKFKEWFTQGFLSFSLDTCHYSIFWLWTLSDKKIWDVFHCIDMFICYNEMLINYNEILINHNKIL